ncbi:MAG: hypothetical protein ABIH46_05970 [Chloroflexota bacterium]
MPEKKKLKQLQHQVHQRGAQSHISLGQPRRPYVCRQCGTRYTGARCPKCGGK